MFVPSKAVNKPTSERGKREIRRIRNERIELFWMRVRFTGVVILLFWLLRQCTSL